METNSCNLCEEPIFKPMVVEMVCTLNFGGYWFLHRHQYPYVRTEVLKANPEYPNINDNPFYDYNVVYLEKEKTEIAIPAHVGILTDKILTPLEQDTLMYLREKYSDKIKDRWAEYKRSLPIGETDETYGKATYRFPNIRQILDEI